jgi:hypothetical protein
MLLEEPSSSLTCSGMRGDMRTEWCELPEYLPRPEAKPLDLLGMLELRAGLEDDLITVRSVVTAIQGRKPVDLAAILKSLRYADRLAAQLTRPIPPFAKNTSRFEKQRLLGWMSEFSIAGRDAVCSSVTLVQSIRDTELDLLLILERHERETRMAIHSLDEHVLESEPKSVEEACGLLTHIGGLLTADTTIDYSFFSTLVVECVRVIEANTGISATARIYAKE